MEPLGNFTKETKSCARMFRAPTDYAQLLFTILFFKFECLSYETAVFVLFLNQLLHLFITNNFREKWRRILIKIGWNPCEAHPGHTPINDRKTMANR